MSGVLWPGLIRRACARCWKGMGRRHTRLSLHPARHRFAHGMMPVESRDESLVGIMQRCGAMHTGARGIH
jgi:hypothetical protein